MSQAPLIVGVLYKSLPRERAGVFSPFLVSEEEYLTSRLNGSWFIALDESVYLIPLATGSIPIHIKFWSVTHNRIVWANVEKIRSWLLPVSYLTSEWFVL